MVVLTETAASVIRRLGDHPELPADAGLRIAGPADGSEHLTAIAAPAPRDGDQVVEQEGARLFLEPEAAAVLDDKVLDAQIDSEGGVIFRLASQ